MPLFLWRDFGQIILPRDFIFFISKGREVSLHDFFSCELFTIYCLHTLTLARKDEALPYVANCVS